MKIAFIGEAVSGFGGMETVIRDVITTFRQQHIYSEMFFFCRNDKMDKGWLEGIKYSCSFSMPPNPETASPINAIFIETLIN
ncbi:hypothetical protein BU68_25415 [Escherichia coli]|nr:hypothetical protein BU68_25415 [Escherichia coli]